jgi:hypothetical protein
MFQSKYPLLAVVVHRTKERKTMMKTAVTRKNPEIVHQETWVL